MPTTWTIAVDWDRDGNYTGQSDDITSYVIVAQWFLGLREPYEYIADNAMLGLTLRNTDKRFSPENASGPLFGKLVPQRPIRIQSNDGTTTRTHWVGWIQAIQPAVNRYGERLTKVLATGSMQFLKATETQIALQQNKRTDEVVAELVKEVVFPPALSGAWVLGRVGNSEVGASTWLADTSAYSSLDQGKLKLGVAGDNWVTDGGPSNLSKNAFDVYQAIADITNTEHGKFFFDREGKAIFWNRHHLLQGGTPIATFNDTMTELAYQYASVEQTKNEVVVICHPRTVSASNTDILWQLSDAIIRVEPNKTREIYVKYEDQDGQRVGAREVSVTDVTFDSGTASVSVTPGANGATLTFTNSGSVPAIVNACIVRGRKIQDNGEMEAKAIDSASLVDYGRRTLRMNLPSVDSLEQAQYIADFERDRRGQPSGMVNALTLMSHGKNGGNQHTHQLARTIGDLITVQETQTGHNRDYTIIGEAHELSEGTTLWKTTWYLEPMPGSYPWQLGATNRSELGAATRLAY